ncbi:FeoB-associated Cys-rich membrane protein [Pelosinus sp. sgz500959]
MQTAIVYIIGAVAVGYFAITIWKKIKGQGSCCGSDGCGSCGSTGKCK